MSRYRVAPPTLPTTTRVGDSVFALFRTGDASAWAPRRIGRVMRVTAAGYKLDTGRVCGRTECPLFTSLDEAMTWAGANPLRMPTAPGT